MFQASWGDFTPMIREGVRHRGKYIAANSHTFSVAVLLSITMHKYEGSVSQSTASTVVTLLTTTMSPIRMSHDGSARTVNGACLAEVYEAHAQMGTS